jgi:predicted HicB family RNase H-like nuclease
MSAELIRARLLTLLQDVSQAFYDSVDDYLEWCEELGEEPDRHFLGKLPFRTTPEHHRQIYMAAKKASKSINAWMDEVLAKAAEEAIRS